MKTVQDILDLLEAGKITPETKLVVETCAGRARWAQSIVAEPTKVVDPGQWYGSHLQNDVLWIKGYDLT